MDIVINGNRNLSAIEEARFTASGIPYRLVNRHSPLVTIGKGDILHFDNALRNPEEGLSFNLHNNVWGTNFRYGTKITLISDLY
jgi:hypothetical protein